MNANEIYSRLNTLQGSFGAIVRTHNSRDVMVYRANERFGLASAAKVALGALVSSFVSGGDLSWTLPLKGISLDPKEDSAVLYPHLQGMSELPLHHVVEIMIACHDHHCADAVADVLGGWSAAAEHVRTQFPGIRIHPNPRDEESNTGELQSLLGILQYLVNGYRSAQGIFEPVIAGLVRMADKTPGIPPQHQWNITGGLPNALINAGVLGDPVSDAYLLYAIAGRDLENRNLTSQADDFVSGLICQLYETWKNGCF